MVNFKASYDKSVVLITIGCTLLFGGISVLFLRIHPKEPAEIIVVSLIVLSTLIGYVFVFLYSPLRYAIDSENLLIVRPLKSVVIKRTDIVDISIPDKKTMIRSGRIGGVGGFFGFYGQFYNKNFGGEMTWYATRLSNFVLIKIKVVDKRWPKHLKFKLIVLTPDNYVGFVDELNKIYAGTNN